MKRHAELSCLASYTPFFCCCDFQGAMTFAAATAAFLLNGSNNVFDFHLPSNTPSPRQESEKNIIMQSNVEETKQEEARIAQENMLKASAVAMEQGELIEVSTTTSAHQADESPVTPKVETMVASVAKFARNTIAESIVQLKIDTKIADTVTVMKNAAIEAAEQIEPTTKVVNALKSTRDAIFESSAQIKLDATISNVAKFAREEVVAESSPSIKLDSKMADSIKSIKDTVSKPLVQIGAAFLVSTPVAASILGKRKSTDDIVRKVKQKDSEVENDVSIIKERILLSKNTTDTALSSEKADFAVGVSLAVTDVKVNQDIDVAKDEDMEPILVLSSRKETIEAPSVERMDMKIKTFVETNTERTSTDKSTAVEDRRAQRNVIPTGTSEKQEKYATKVISDEAKQPLVLASTMKIVETPVIESKTHEPRGQVGTANRVEGTMAPAVATITESIEDSIEISSPVLFKDQSLVVEEVDTENDPVLAMETVDEPVEQIDAVDTVGDALLDTTVSDTIDTVEEKPIVALPSALKSVDAEEVHAESNSETVLESYKIMPVPVLTAAEASAVEEVDIKSAKVLAAITETAEESNQHVDASDVLGGAVLGADISPPEEKAKLDHDVVTEVEATTVPPTAMESAAADSNPEEKANGVAEEMTVRKEPAYGSLPVQIKFPYLLKTPKSFEVPTTTPIFANTIIKPSFVAEPISPKVKPSPPSPESQEITKTPPISKSVSTSFTSEPIYASIETSDALKSVRKKLKVALKGVKPAQQGVVGWDHNAMPPSESTVGSSFLNAAKRVAARASSGPPAPSSPQMKPLEVVNPGESIDLTDASTFSNSFARPLVPATFSALYSSPGNELDEDPSSKVERLKAELELAQKWQEENIGIQQEDIPREEESADEPSEIVLLEEEIDEEMEASEEPTRLPPKPVNFLWAKGPYHYPGKPRQELRPKSYGSKLIPLTVDSCGPTPGSISGEAYKEHY